jgi:RNA 2',3'-cyclic 3'-phosphodiesterase
MRLFFALWPPRDAALELERWAQSLDGRRARPDKIHLTLAFLGEADAEKAKVAAGRVQASRFHLPLDEVRYWAHNQIVWAGPRRVPPELAQLAEALQLELYKEGFMLERRPFAAHVTLARKAAPVESLPPLPGLRWPVAEFTLVGSSLRAGGSEYQILERFALA